MNRSRYLLPILAIALFPSTAMANAGTSLMWASALHMAFGNAVIGVIEGQLLSRIFKSPKQSSILILIVANYVSAWIGHAFVVNHLTSLQDITIVNIQFWFMALVAVAVLVTLLIEFPFFWFALRSREKPFRQALMAIPLIHGVSYALLFGWYWMASGTSMMTQLQVISPNEMTLTEPYHLYYISLDGDQVLRMDLNDPDHSTEVITELAATHFDDRLFARKVSESDFDLFVRLESEVRGNEERRLVLDSFSERAPIDWRVAEGHSDVAGTMGNIGEVPSLAEESDWRFDTGHWASYGIWGGNEKNGRIVHFSLETPFAAWSIRNATHLEGDFLVFQLGDDQICLMHPELRRITLIARGKGPIVAKP